MSVKRWLPVAVGLVTVAGCQTLDVGNLNAPALDDLLSNRIKELPGIARTRTTIALGTIKESVVCPVESDEEQRKDN